MKQHIARREPFSVDSVQIFQSHRPRLFGLAYRMLGARDEAEDVLQDAYLRWRDVDPAQVRSTEAWLTTSVTRLSIDRLRRLKTEREAYFGPWLPEPLSDEDMRTPEMAIELQDDVSIAFLTLLEALAPDERAAFVLHDVLDDDYVDIAEALGKSEAACRQMVHRAREKVTSKRRRFQVDDATRRRMLERFIAIATQGDRKQIVQLFASDAVMTSDGGGKAIAVFRPLLGAQRISYLYHALSRRLRESVEVRVLTVNGELGIGCFWGSRLRTLIAFDTDGERIHSMYAIRNPDKLRAYDEARLAQSHGVDR